MKKIREKKFWGGMLLLFCLIFMAVPMNTEAAKLSKNKQKKLYGQAIAGGQITAKDLFYKNTVTFPVKYFTLIDVNQDGIYELFVTGSKRTGYEGTQGVEHNVFTIKGNKVVYYGTCYNYEPLHKTVRKVYYNKKYKGIICQGHAYHVQCLAMVKMNKKYGFRMLYYTEAKEKPTAKYYTSKKNIKVYSYRSNTRTNRKKYLKYSK